MSDASSPIVSELDCNINFSRTSLKLLEFNTILSNIGILQHKLSVVCTCCLSFDSDGVATCDRLNVDKYNPVATLCI